jgi:serine/threonine-protein kinase RIM15
VKEHPFFKGVDWDTILEQEAVFIPKVTDLDDTSYFDGNALL